MAKLVDQIKDYFLKKPKVSDTPFELRKAEVDAHFNAAKAGEITIPAVTAQHERVTITHPVAAYTVLPNTPVVKGQELIKVIPEVTVKPLTAHDVVETDIEKSAVAFINVTKKFGDKVALDNLNFVVRDPERKGRLISIVGQSGCGKSTLLRMIAGLHPHAPASSGVILVDGKPLKPPGSDRGLVDQKYSLFPHLTVVENIAFGLRIQGVSKKDATARAMDWVKKVALEGSEGKYPSELSGGMQQRVSIAATLVLSPKILLLDEPFGALDPKIRLRMQELLIELWKEQKATVFLVTHSIEEAIYVGDRVFRMGSNPGRLVEQLNVPRPDEPPEVFRTRPWFNEIVTDLRMRLEQDAPAKGELPNGKL